MELLLDPNVWLAFLTLTVLEIVLGVDNVVFIAILAGKLPKEQQARARTVGLSLALITRILFLSLVVWIASLTRPLFSLIGNDFSGRDLILLLGGLFLIAKAVNEIHAKLEGEQEHKSAPKHASFRGVIVQILLLDIVFSLDSVITAIGLSNLLPVMIAAVIVAMLFMLWSAGAMSRFLERHPTVQMLALAFLVLIGVNLVADGLGHHIPRGYTYFAMAFSVAVEILNIRVRAKGAPVHLHRRLP